MLYVCVPLLQAAKEVSTALSLNYPSSADMAAICGYERPLDRCVCALGLLAPLCTHVLMSSFFRCGIRQTITGMQTV
jgi:hypothetical protein